MQLQTVKASVRTAPLLATMSRASPFPTSSARRPRTPIDSSSYGEELHPYSSPTRPLQISRSSRAETIGSPNGPSRPLRSELRSRQVSEYSNSDQASSSRQAWDVGHMRDRGSVSTTRSDGSMGNTYRARANSSGQRTVDTNVKRSQTQDSETTVSPSHMAAIMAFQNAGQRKRAQTNGSDDFEYEKEKRQARERERLMQERIKQKAPGRRMNGKAKAGDIDGTPEYICSWQILMKGSSCLGRDQGRMGFRHRPRCGLRLLSAY